MGTGLEPVDDLRRGQNEARPDLRRQQDPCLAFYLKTKLLFLCSRNQWRSPTAEALFKNHPRYDARSAGTSRGARIKVTTGLIGWADLVFCMERKHALHVQTHFSDLLETKPVITLRIPDNYLFMDPTLIAQLRSTLAPHLAL